jgi:hypothetical protein
MDNGRKADESSDPAATFRWLLAIVTCGLTVVATFWPPIAVPAIGGVAAIIVLHKRARARKHSSVAGVESDPRPTR